MFVDVPKANFQFVPGQYTPQTGAGAMENTLVSTHLAWLCGCVHVPLYISHAVRTTGARAGTPSARAHDTSMHITFATSMPLHLPKKNKLSFAPQEKKDGGLQHFRNTYAIEYIRAHIRAHTPFASGSKQQCDSCTLLTFVATLLAGANI